MTLWIRIILFLAIFASTLESTSFADTHIEENVQPEKIDVLSDSISMIKRYEWLELSAYWDHAGCSIWYGSRANSCDETITLQEANRRLSVTVQSLVTKVHSDFPELHDEWKVALVSFRYNCERWYQDVKKNGLARHSLWCKKASGVVLRWLVIRRAEESRMIFK